MIRVFGMVGIFTLLAGNTASAGDAAFFADLIPGVPVEEQTLREIYGKGPNINLTLADGSVVNFGESDFSQNAVSSTTLNNNSGITNAFSVIGDYNSISVNVNVEVNLGTVTIQDVVGNPIVTQNIDNMGGGVIDIGR